MNSYIKNVILQFNYYKNLGEKTIAQLNIEEIQKKVSYESNSISIIIQHLSGNMLSRWTDVMTTDGEKPWRKRDEEFTLKNHTKEEILTIWNTGWDCLLNTLEKLTEKDLDTIIYIRNIGQTLQDGINRQLCHYSYHVGQIIFIGKMIKDKDWQQLSIAKNDSTNYNANKFSQEKSIKRFF
jgi:Protein of unknown function (DUF1572)